MPRSSSSSASSRSVSPPPSSQPRRRPQDNKTKASQDSTPSKPEEPEDPHTSAARRLPTRPWTANDEAHLLSLHQLTYADARFNPPPPSAWKRVALVCVCVGLVWWAFSARLGMWERKREGGRRAFMYAKQHAQSVADTSLGALKTRPTVVPAFQHAAPVRDEI